MNHPPRKNVGVPELHNKNIWFQEAPPLAERWHIDSFSNIQILNRRVNDPHPRVGRFKYEDGGGWVGDFNCQGGLLLGWARGQNTGGGEEMGEIIHENVNILF